MNLDIDQKLTQIEVALRQVARTITVICDEMRIHSEQVATIVRLLTPEEEAESGSDLEVLLRVLIAKLDGQAIYLTRISRGIEKLAGGGGKIGSGHRHDKPAETEAGPV